MVSGLVVSTALDETWEETAKKLFAGKSVGVMTLIDGKFTIFAKVVGYVEDKNWGRLIQIQRVDEHGRSDPEGDAGTHSTFSLEIPNGQR